MNGPRMNRPVHRLPVAHVPTATALIGGLAVLLAGGLQWLGVLARADGVVAAVLREGMGQSGSGGGAKTLPEWIWWAGTVVVAFGLSVAMLSVPGTWRRLVLWLTTLVLVAGWAPVLALASREPRVSGPLVAVIWVGMCAWFYARTHILPCEPAKPAAVRGRGISSI